MAQQARWRAFSRVGHRWAGLVLGAWLAVVGVSGALLTYRVELLAWANPGVSQVALRPGPVLTPGALLARLPASLHGRPIATLTMFAQAGAAPRLILAEVPGQPAQERVFFLDPYTGQPRAQHGETVFETIEALHRWLLLPKEPGRWVVGSLALVLLLMGATGLVVRSPRRGARLSAWARMFKVDWRLRGRAFWWSLHSALGVWLLPVYLLSSVTGVYWAFDSVRVATHAAVGAAPPQRMPRQPGPVDTSTAQELERAWQALNDAGVDWTSASLRPSRAPGHPVQITWLAADAFHDRERNLMQIAPHSGMLERDVRHAAQSAGERVVRWVHPLHTGSWAGTVSRAVMLLASLALLLFVATGWWLYAQRPQQRERVQVRSA
ncbi:PepSY-associated TM helix domain-containing protein [Ottowia sp.]|uniref:PepSY-associated TM helix domain-containing protein n=1 Tax=Ottowia sp. TaxID=1898956 RepID=UPI003A84C7B2